jgi:hypothetical protein
VIVTEYVPEVLTMIEPVEAPVDQRYAEAPAGAVSFTLLPSQKMVSPVIVILGCGGRGWTKTDSTSDVAGHPSAVMAITLYAPVIATVICCDVAPFDHE